MGINISESYRRYFPSDKNGDLYGTTPTQSALDVLQDYQILEAHITKLTLALAEKEAIDSINMEMATEVRRLTAENEDLTKCNCLLREENIRLKEYEDFYSKIKMENKDLQERLNLALKAYLTQLQLQTTKTIVVTKENKNENSEANGRHV